STCLGPLPNNTAVARWFVRRRGQALGVATAGISAGGIVFAPLAQHLIARLGWRAAFAVLGLVAAAIVLPPVLLFMRRDPADLGLPESLASLVLGATAGMGVVGKLGFGALLDRFDQRRVAATCFGLQSLGVLILWQTRSAPLLVCYVVLYGYAMGGNATLLA